MLMDRFAGRSVSATIRWHGARKEPGHLQRIKDDLIQDALRLAMGERKYVHEGFVIETGPGEIALTRGIFHVAVVQGAFGQGFTTTMATIATCVDNALEAIEASRRYPYASVLIPLLGTGQGGVPAKDAVPQLVERARAFFRARPRSRLREIYFLAYSRQDVELLKLALGR
jgi:O-acetyl-ADP-ribose deacetylase (regulator of RNase III)